MSKTNPNKKENERGQVIILTVLIMTVFFIIGFIVVDVTLWLTERRGAQKDADATTLAGAYQLLGQDFADPDNNILKLPEIEAAVTDAVYQWADLNDLPAEDVQNLDIGRGSCKWTYEDGTEVFNSDDFIDSVSLDAEHHTQALFSSIFGLGVPEIGAHAMACLGSIVTAEGLFPVAIQIGGTLSDCWRDVDGDGEEDPLFGEECVLTVGAGDTTSGESGSMRLYNDGSFDCSDQGTGGGRTYTDEIAAGGANTECHVYKYFNDPTKTCADDVGGCVYPQEGVPSMPQLKALEDLMASEGECDSQTWGNGDLIDQFLEVVVATGGDPPPSMSALFSRRDCTSPRLVSLIIVDHFTQQGNQPLPIQAFASFFIKECTDDTETISSPKCLASDFPGGIGQIRLRGHFVNILDTSGKAGVIDKWSPKRIALVE